MISATGTFDITSRPEPPFWSFDGVLLGRMEFDKVFHGSLTATSIVYMTYVRTPVESSAGYVAVEWVTGEIDGRSGSFAFLHNGVTTGGDLSLSVAIVPDSGTGELSGIRGSMAIENDAGEHSYTLQYEFTV